MSDHKLDGKSMDIVSDNILKLSEIFPDVVSENKVDFDRLKLELGEDIEISDERYSFNWQGKGDSVRESQKQSKGTLRPYEEESKNWDTTQNLYIEGDNLEVLKLLQKSYYGKVKTIFIDPPYNTGNDFIYPDDYQDNIENYLELTGQSIRDEETGEIVKLSTNPETGGRYHSNWLNMMYPRLKLARNLLSEDGSIFISIDFNEIDNLKKIMDEIFGEFNFQREIIWRIGWLSGYKTTAANFIRNHDTILFYSKNHDKMEFIKKYITNDEFKPLIKKDKKITSKLKSLGLDKDQQEELLEFINHGNRPEKYAIEDTWNSNEYDDLNSIAIVSFSGEKISKILDIDQDFKGQKSVKMLKRILMSTTKDDEIVMDFFSGTGSTAHATMELNSEDGGNRKFIMVQLPEPTGEDSVAFKEGYPTIADIAKERIRRSGDKILANSDENIDIGFKVFKLDSSNLHKWDPEYDDLEQSMLIETVKDDRSNKDLVYEIMLKEGIDLTLPIEQHDKIYSVGKGALLICLNDNITTDICNDILNLKSRMTRVVFKDKCFASDCDKTNIIETLRVNGITEFITI